MNKIKSLIVAGVFIFISGSAFAADGAANRVGTGSNKGATKVAPPQYSSVGNNGGAVDSGEDFKGRPGEKEFTAGGMLGVGEYNGYFGFAFQGNIARRIITGGFAPDINNDVFVELQLGPMWVNGGSAIVYTAALRWDFIKDRSWSYYALGGLGGMFTSKSLNDGETRAYPRLAIGAFYNINDDVKLRGEFSHEFVGVGAAFAF
jgi:hypothetical protein